MVEPDRLDQLAQESLRNPPATRLTLGEITQRAHTRNRRSRLARASAGLVAALTVVAVSWMVDGDNDASVNTVAAVERTSGGIIELAASGIWPAGDGASTPRLLAEDFADQVLNWPDADITTDEAASGDPTWLTIHDPTTGTRLRALAVPTSDTDHWRLIQIGNGLLYRPGDTGVRVEFGDPPASATEVIVYAATDLGTQHFRGPITDTMTSIELTGLTDRSELRSVLILYQTADGQVLDAAGGVIDL